jgi:fucose permease
MPIITRLEQLSFMSNAIRKPRFFLLFIAYIGFISLGLPDAILGVAWPFIRESYLLPQSGLGLVLIAAGLGYFMASFNMGYLVQRLKIGWLLTLSTLFLAVSLTGYALSGNWLFFLACATIAGMGGGAIDGGLNLYAAEHFSGRQMNWLHASYGLGATVGPLIMTGALQQTGNWRWGYGLVAACMVVMTAVFFFTRQQWTASTPQADLIETDETPVSSPAAIIQPVPAAAATATVTRPLTMRLALKNRLVQLHIGLFLLYTGLEVTAGQWSFTLLTEARGVDVAQAGIWVSAYWAFLTIGRVAFGVLVSWMSMTRLVRLSMITAVFGTILLAVRGGPILSLAGLALLGFALAPIFPCLMKQTPERLGKRLATYAIGFQVSAAMLGAIIVPGLTGLLVQWYTLELIGIVLITVALLLFLLHESVVRSA